MELILCSIYFVPSISTSISSLSLPIGLNALNSSSVNIPDEFKEDFLGYENYILAFNRGDWSSPSELI